MRVHGDASLPTLIYLPGLHGDWTLVGSFRRALGGRVRFVEVTYPRTLTWSLEDYARGVETALAEQGITRGWLLGESFSSQVVWSLVARERFQIEGVILAGGFVRHPMRWGVRLAERLCGGISARPADAHPVRLCQGGSLSLPPCAGGSGEHQGVHRPPHGTGSPGGHPPPAPHRAKRPPLHRPAGEPCPFMPSPACSIPSCPGFGCGPGSRGTAPTSASTGSLGAPTTTCSAPVPNPPPNTSCGG